MSRDAKSKNLSIFDIDGTLVCSTGSLEHAWLELFGEKLSPAAYGKLARKEKHEVLHLCCSKFADETYPNPRVIQKLNEAKKSGNRVVIVSGRQRDLLEDTKKLLRKFDVKYDEIMLKQPEIKTYDFKLAKVSEIYELVKPKSTEIYDDLYYILDGVHGLLCHSTDIKPYLVENGIPIPYNPG